MFKRLSDFRKFGQRYVCGQPDRLAAGRCDFGRDHVDTLLFEVGHDDRGAGIGQPQRNRATDAARGAGHDGAAILEIEQVAGPVHVLPLAVKQAMVEQ